MTEGRSFVCHNCLEPATSTGPRGRGSATLCLLHADRWAFVFCSPECREWWFSVAGSGSFDSREVRVADDLTPADLAERLP